MRFFERYKIRSAKDVVDAAILMILGAALLGYSTYYKSFAEVHIQIPGLNFPIFIGEIILFFCMILTIYKWFLIKKKFSKSYIVLAIYFLLVLTKAFIGYRQFGPLAFRHAALFYYPLFALIAYELYTNKFKDINILALLFITLVLIKPITFYNFIYFTLMLLYIIKVRSKAVKLAGLAIMLAFFPLRTIAYCNRTQFIGHVAGFFSLGILILLILKIKGRYKITVFVLSLILFMISFSKVGSISGRARSLAQPGAIIASLKEWDKIIDPLRKRYQRKYISPKIYNPDSRNSLNSPRFIKLAKKGDEKEYDLLEDLSIDSTKVAIDVRNSETKAELITFLKSKNISVKGEGTIFLELPKDKKTKKEIVTFLQDIRLVQRTSSKHAIERKILSQFSTEKELEEFETNKRGEVVKAEILGAYNTAVFRLLVWRDMARELIAEKAIFGFDFGKPFRSESIEVVNMGYGEWSRDGWVAAHNSYMEAIYRSGIIGIGLILSFFTILLRMTIIFIKAKSLTGAFLVSIILSWLVMALVYVALEMPFIAISLWSVFGVGLAHSHKLSKSKQ